MSEYQDTEQPVQEAQFEYPPYIDINRANELDEQFSPEDFDLITPEDGQSYARVMLPASLEPEITDLKMKLLDYAKRQYETSDVGDELVAGLDEVAKRFFDQHPSSEEREANLRQELIKRFTTPAGRGESFESYLRRVANAHLEGSFENLLWYGASKAWVQELMGKKPDEIKSIHEKYLGLTEAISPYLSNKGMLKKDEKGVYKEPRFIVTGQSGQEIFRTPNLESVQK